MTRPSIIAGERIAGDMRSSGSESVEVELVEEVDGMATWANATGSRGEERNA